MALIGARTRKYGRMTKLRVSFRPGRGNTSTHLVNTSVTMSMYALPRDEVSRGPIISQVTFSSGQLATSVPSDAWGLWVGRFLLWHLPHSWIHSLASSWYLGQYSIVLWSLQSFSWPQYRWPAWLCMLVIVDVITIMLRESREHVESGRQHPVDSL